MATHRDRLGAAEAEGGAGGAGSAGVEVVLLSDPATPAPPCPHGGSVLGLRLVVWRRAARATLSFHGLLVLLSFYQPVSSTVCDSQKTRLPREVVVFNVLKKRHGKSPLWRFWPRV